MQKLGRATPSIGITSQGSRYPVPVKQFGESCLEGLVELARPYYLVSRLCYYRAPGRGRIYMAEEDAVPSIVGLIRRYAMLAFVPCFIIFGLCRAVSALSRRHFDLFKFVK